jgi:class 3 adenylate cyclase/tetratricopeptide (TPR) repeat protein
MSCGSPLPLEEPAPQLARKTVTVLFCDLVGSTALGERLDPESVREVITRFYREMRSALERHGGAVEKYIGDAVMAVFGVPLLHEDDALRGVQAAATMRETLGQLNVELERRFGVTLEIRIGVNTGEVVVGDPNAGQALVVGDAVNVAARLEQAAAPSEVLLGPGTYELVRQHVRAEPTPPLALKGKAEDLVAYRLLEVAPGPDAIGERPDLPLIGRVSELEHLRSAFERAAKGSSVVTTVVGSAGVGKSRLAREFLDALPDDARILRTRCLPYGDGITFWPVTELVKGACAIRDDESRASARAKIDASVAGAQDGSLIAERVAGVVGFADVVAGLQESFWSIRRFLEWIGRDRPVVLLLDDLQWAEPTMLDLVEYLAGWTQGIGLHLLCLARPDLLEERPTWASTAPDASTLPLGPLDERETQHFITEALGGGLAGRALERIEEAAGGNPLFLEEMLRMLEDRGLLERRDGRWVASDDLSDVRLPGSIQALLEARLDGLSSEEHTVIRCAAVIGKAFWWSAVAELVPAELRARVGAHLQTLVRKDLIRPDRSTMAGEDAFRFHHILIQEAAYAGTPKDARAALHERFAGWIEVTAGDRLAEVEPLIGYHLERAYRYRAELASVTEAERAIATRAAGWLAKAGTRALERRDVPAAIDLLTRATELYARDAPERGSLLLELADMLAESGDLTAAEDALEDADRFARSTGDEGLQAKAAILRLLLLESTDPKRLTVDAVVAAERLIAVLERLGDDLGLTRAWRVLGDLQSDRSRYAAADEALQHAIHHARRAGARRDEAEALGRYTGTGVFGPAAVAEIERRCAELLARTSSGGYEAPALRALAEVRAMQGRFDEARQLARRSRDILFDLGLRLRASWVTETSGYIELRAGDLSAAEREFRSGYEEAEELGELGFRATAAAEIGRVLVMQGRVQEGERFVGIAEATAAEEDTGTHVLCLGARARILAAGGEADEAERTGRRAVTLSEQTDDVNMQGDALVDLGDVYRELGREDEAVRSFEMALLRYAAKGNVAAAERVRPRVSTGPGRGARA